MRHDIVGALICAFIGGGVSFLIGGLDQSVFVMALLGAYIGYSGGEALSEDSEEGG